MIARKVDYVPSGVINVDNIQEYYQPSEDAIDNLTNYDIPRMQGILDKPMRVISLNQPSNPEQGMAWFKLFN